MAWVKILTIPQDEYKLWKNASGPDWRQTKIWISIF
jgi:hypothetical protein